MRRSLGCAAVLFVVGCGGNDDDASVAEPRAATAEAQARTTAVPPTSTSTTTAVPLIVTTAAPPTAPADGLTVTGVTDGDTLTVSDGRRVRLAQVDAPETYECFGSQSTAALRALSLGKTVDLRRRPDAPAKDKYGRTLAEVLVGGVSVDETLIRDGAAEWYEEFAAEDTHLAGRLEAAEQEARAAARGLWAACSTPPTALPASSATTAALPLSGSGDCDPAYPDVCIPPRPPDLDCSSIRFVRFRVLAPDPHGFDGDHDGIGCQS